MWHRAVISCKSVETIGHSKGEKVFSNSELCGFKLKFRWTSPCLRITEFEEFLCAVHDDFMSEN